MKTLEALEALKVIYNSQDIQGGYDEFWKAYRIIEKSLKALEIIKEKKVNVGDFVRCKNMQDYNDYCCYNEKEQLTQEEYDLLKEVLL